MPDTPVITAAEIAAADNKSLLEMLERRHPAYEDRVDHWRFCDATYAGGPAWFADNLFSYVKEGEGEFEERVARAYRFNHTKEVVDLVNKYIFKSEITRREDDVPSVLKDFWKKATFSAAPIESLMRVAGERSSRNGTTWVVVDSSNKGGAKSIADAKRDGDRVYGYTVKAEDALNFAFDESGQLLWWLGREGKRDDASPLTGSGEVEDRFRLWTREAWFLFRLDDQGDKRKTPKVVLESFGEHKLGRVPLVRVTHQPDAGAWDNPGLVDDIAYLDRAVANYLSNMDAIIQDQTFSQLAIPSQSLPPEEEGPNALLTLSTKRAFTYNADGAKGPEYIAPDPKQAQLILSIINKVVAEIYHTVGLAGERTKEDNSVGIDNSSGVAKAYDFERVNAMLVSKAGALEIAENEIAEIVCLWHSAKIKEGTRPVSYPKTFDVRSLYDEFEIAEKLSLFEAPKGVRREQMKTLVQKLLPRLGAERVEELIKEIDEDWLEIEPELLQPADPAGRPKAPATPKPTAANRQGQVTAKTQ